VRPEALSLRVHQVHPHMSSLLPDDERLWLDRAHILAADIMQAFRQRKFTEMREDGSDMRDKLDEHFIMYLEIPRC
jgi:hypothetical protein